MITLPSLPETIPLFPLKGALLLPRASLPLNIFEPRYIQMINDALKTQHRMIGMIQPRDVPHDMGNPPLHKIGCAGRITSFSETSDGRYMISLSGISRFRLMHQQDDGAPYSRGDVDWSSFERDLTETEQDPKFDRPTFLKTLDRYFKAAQLDSDWDNLTDAEPELLINSLSILCPFADEERQALLEAVSLQNRRETLVTLMEFAMRPVEDRLGKIQ